MPCAEKGCIFPQFGKYCAMHASMFADETATGFRSQSDPLPVIDRAGIASISTRVVRAKQQKERGLPGPDVAGQVYR
jgi:hypothetical protein